MTEKIKKIRDGFTFVELMIAGLIFLLMMGALYFMLYVGEQSRFFGDIQGTLQQEARSSMDRLLRDLGQTDPSSSFTAIDSNFIDPQTGEYYEMLIFPTAKTAPPGETFTRDALGNPVWQGVVVYYPYHRASISARQLRRYVSYDTNYTFPFSVTNITNTTITIEDSSGPANQIIIDRENWPYTQVFVNNLASQGVDFSIDGAMISAAIYLSHPGRGTRQVLFGLKSGVVAKK